MDIETSVPPENNLSRQIKVDEKHLFSVISEYLKIGFWEWLRSLQIFNTFSFRPSRLLRNSPGSGLAIGKRCLPTPSLYGIPYDKA
ncbi:MAG: hypothetical protein GTN73_02755 [Candidatus Aminicenantes bacterium]|nr:hypothetical protein [Candidatus Aminicenantes bacterium]